MRYGFALLVRRRSPVVVGLVAIVLAFAADASKPRLRLERIDARDFASDGTVRVFASVVELEGNVDDGRAAPAFVLKMNGKSVGRPIKSQQFQGAAEALDLVLVVESSALYGPAKILPPAPLTPRASDKRGTRKATATARQKPDRAVAAPVLKPATGEEPLDKVKDAVHALLESLAPRVRVLLIDYGADLTPHTPFKPAAAAANDVDDLMPDGEAGDLALTRAVRAALVELGRPRPDGAAARKLIVVLSDGLSTQMDRKTFKALGDEAARARVPIHTIGFSPSDERGPLLNLGEISKRSNGTFRWARNAEDLRAQIETLGDELNKQYVLTYKIDARSLEQQTFQLTCEELVSNALVYDSSGGSFGYVPATRALLPWWLWALAGLVLFGGAAAIVLARARPKKPMRFSPYRDAAGGAARSAADPSPSAPPSSSAAPRQPMAPLAAAGRPIEAVPPAREPAPSRGLLIVVSGALAGQRVAVAAQPITIGKGPATLQVTDDPALSTRHAELALRGGAFVLTDLGSTNGSFVNSQRIAQPTRLSDGDLLRFGNTQMKFRTES